MATHKVVTLEATFPELVVKRMYQQGRGQGSTLKSAFAAAGRDLFSKKDLRGRRLTMAKIVVSIGTVEVETETETVGG